MRIGKKLKKPVAGFSLLELLAVMSIMALLSTLAVTSYFGAVRGMSIRSAKRHFEGALVQARQRACIDGSRVCLIAFNEIASYDDKGEKVKDMAACYVVCKEVGRISFVSGNNLFDEFSDLKQLFGEQSGASSGTVQNEGGVRLYNLSDGTWTLVKPYVTRANVGSSMRLMYSNVSHQFQAYAFQQQTGTDVRSSGARAWEVGDSYGIEVTPVQSLPKGFMFSNLSSTSLTDVKFVTFESDGTVRSGSANSFTIKAPQSAGGEDFTFQIASDGRITYP